MEFEIPELNTLDEVNAYLEEHCRSFDLRKREAADLYVKIRDQARLDKDELMEMLAEWEGQFWLFRLSKGDCIPEFSQVAKDGQVVFAYPDLGKLPAEAHAHALKRLDESANHYLRIRYGMVLWNWAGHKKHLRYAQAALDSLYNCLSTFAFSDDLRRRGVTTYLALASNAAALATATKHLKDEVRELLLVQLDRLGFLDNTVKLLLIERLQEQSKFLGKPEQNQLLAHCVTLYQAHVDAQEWDLGNRTSQAAIYLARKVGADPKPWFLRIGHCTTEQAIHRNDDNGIASLVLYRRAYDAYQKAGDATVTAAATVRLNDAKKKLRLSRVELPVDNQAAKTLQRLVDIRLRWFLTQPDELAFGFLASGYETIPTKAGTVRAVTSKNQRDGRSMRDIISTLALDINKNFKTGGTPAENELEDVKEFYHHAATLQTLNIIGTLFVEGQRKRKFTYERVIEFFRAHSWFATALTGEEDDGQVYQYDWLSLLAPALYEYFRQVEVALWDTSHQPNLILCLDSLTPKIEGLLRDLARHLGADVLTPDKGGGLREKYIDDLLREPKVIAALGEDKCTFLAYALSSFGVGIRNNVAHSFYRARDYSLQKMFLVLMCLFLLSGFKVTHQEENVVN